MNQDSKATPPEELDAVQRASLDRKPAEPLMSRADIRGQTQRTYQTIRIPEWENSKIRLRSWTLKERIAFKAAHRKRKEEVDEEVAEAQCWAFAAIMSICDERGELIMKTSDVDDLIDLHSKAIERIYDMVNATNALSEDEETEIEKNS
ncbi:MAG: hypothetical protein ACJ8C4_05765 [Gemmataceae bacterium]